MVPLLTFMGKSLEDTNFDIRNLIVKEDLQRILRDITGDSIDWDKVDHNKKMADEIALIPEESMEFWKALNEKYDLMHKYKGKTLKEFPFTQIFECLELYEFSFKKSVRYVLKHMKRHKQIPYSPYLKAIT